MRIDVDQLRASLPEDLQKLPLENFKWVSRTDHYKIFTWHWTEENEDLLYVCVDDTYIVMFSRKRGSERGTLSLEVSRGVESLLGLTCKEKGKFPNVYHIVPQTGPDARRFALFDFDFDGVFDKKVRTIEELLRQHHQKGLPD